MGTGEKSGALLLKTALGSWQLQLAVTVQPNWGWELAAVQNAFRFAGQDTEQPRQLPTLEAEQARPLPE